MALASKSNSPAQDIERNSAVATQTEEITASTDTTSMDAPVATGKGQPAPLTRSNIIAMQRTVGNQAVQRMIARQKEAAKPAQPARAVQHKVAAPVEEAVAEEETETETTAEPTLLNATPTPPPDDTNPSDNNSGDTSSEETFAEPAAPAAEAAPHPVERVVQRDLTDYLDSADMALDTHSDPDATTKGGMVKQGASNYFGNMASDASAVVKGVQGKDETNLRQQAWLGSELGNQSHGVQHYALLPILRRGKTVRKDYNSVLKQKHLIRINFYGAGPEAKKFRKIKDMAHRFHLAAMIAGLISLIAGLCTLSPAAPAAAAVAAISGVVAMAINAVIVVLKAILIGRNVQRLMNMKTSGEKKSEIWPTLAKDILDLFVALVGVAAGGALGHLTGVMHMANSGIAAAPGALEAIPEAGLAGITYGTEAGAMAASYVPKSIAENVAVNKSLKEREDSDKMDRMMAHPSYQKDLEEYIHFLEGAKKQSADDQALDADAVKKEQERLDALTQTKQELVDAQGKAAKAIQATTDLESSGAGVGKIDLAGQNQGALENINTKLDTIPSTEKEEEQTDGEVEQEEASEKSDESAEGTPEVQAKAPESGGGEGEKVERVFDPQAKVKVVQRDGFFSKVKNFFAKSVAKRLKSAWKELKNKITKLAMKVTGMDKKLAEVSTDMQANAGESARIAANLQKSEALSAKQGTAIEQHLGEVKSGASKEE